MPRKIPALVVLLFLAASTAARPPARGQAEHAVERALSWLAASQDVQTTGAWDCRKLGGRPAYDVGVTGLAVVALLNAKEPKPHADNVAKGLDYLVKKQDQQGLVGGRASMHFIYNHIMATHALCEGYARTQERKDAAQKAVNLLLHARNPFLGWRYGVRPGENDSSVTGWAVVALGAARAAGLRVDQDAFKGARAWMEKMTDPKFGQVGYVMAGGMSARPEGLQNVYPSEKTQAMTAAGILARLMANEDASSDTIRKGVKLIAELPPAWKRPRIDMVFWHHATLMFSKMQHPAWQRWRDALAATLVANQKQDGSWDPAGPWGPDGGRVYATALMAITLQKAARSLPQEKQR